MRKYIKEAIIFLIQLLMFYVFPLFAGPTDAIGMVLLIIWATLSLSLVLGAMSGNKLKYLYPFATALAFIPSVFIYYNESALIHAVWYLVMSGVGLLVGSIARRLIYKK